MDFHLILWMYLQFQNTGTILGTITFLWLVDPKLIDMVEIRFRIELSSQIWNLLPSEIKKPANLDSLISKTKQQWRCLEWPCTLCKTSYVKHIIM